MKFSTPITDFGNTFCIEPQHHILMLGSCFANVVGQRLSNYRLRTLLNPMGTLYNPQSIFNLLNSALDLAEGKITATEEAGKYLFQSIDKRWYSWMAASLINGSDSDECHRNMTEALQDIATFISKTDVLILTFGTDRYYGLKDADGMPVANCHKMPGNFFEETSMSVDNITRCFLHTYHRLKAMRPEIKVILTVSPYRYLKYGLHQSKLSKARLLLAIEECMRQHPELYYFPAYEILNDELRDYRFYASDMVHPSEVAEEYIWQQFCNNYIDQRLQAFFKEWNPIIKMQAHRQMSTNTDENYHKTLEARIALIRDHYPEMF